MRVGYTQRWWIRRKRWVLCLIWLLGGIAQVAPMTRPPAQLSANMTWVREAPPRDASYIDRLMAAMTLDDKIGQMIMIQFVTDGYVGGSVPLLQQVQPGAAVLYRFEMHSPDQVRDMTRRMQADSHIPLLLAADEEGGYIDQFKDFFGWRPSAYQMRDRDDPQFAYAQGRKTGADLLSLGFNTDLAPDVDVEVVHGPDQSTRTFGDTPDRVTRLAGAWLNGLQSTGVIGAAKHFPGLGASNQDAHQTLPVIARSRAQIEQVELVPYRDLLHSADPPGIVMTTDLLLPAVDPQLPAELSPAIITGLLRNELHYQGVVLTDALYMQGISDRYNEYNATVMAFEAGCDLVIGPATVDQAAVLFGTIKDAMKHGLLTQDRIDQSVRRILTLKFNHGLLAYHPDALTSAPLPR